MNSSSCDISMMRNIKNQIHKTQKEILKIQNQASADVKNQHYYEMNVQLGDQNVQVETLLQKNENKLKNCEWSNNLLYMQEASITRLHQIIDDAKKLAVTAMNTYGNPIPIDMKTDCKNMLAAIQDELSTQYFEMNIWSGSHTNELPFKDIVNAKESDNYYLGDDFDLKFHIDGEEYEFGNRANYECFKDVIGALQIMRDSQNPSTKDIDKAKIAEAGKRLQNANDGFLDLVQKVGQIEQVINRAKEEASTNIETLSELYTTSLNGMSEMDQALSAMNAAAIQRKLAYILPITMRYLNEMSIVKHL